MGGIKIHDIRRLKDRLVMIKFREALVWKDDDLQEDLHSNSSSWFSLIKWLLEQLRDDPISSDPEAFHSGIQKTCVGLGLSTSIQAAKLISGQVTLEWKVKFLTRLISLVELKSNHGEPLQNIDEDRSLKIDRILTKLPQVMTSSNSINGGRSTGCTKKESTSQVPRTARTLESYAKDNALLQERVAKAKDEVERMRKELESEEGITASDAIKQLIEEREELFNKLSTLVESLKPLTKEVKNIFETELNDLLPIDVADPIDLPDIESLSDKVKCIMQAENNEKTLENCITTLRNKSYNESPKENWSTKKSSSLPLLQLYEDSQHSLMK